MMRPTQIHETSAQSQLPCAWPGNASGVEHVAPKSTWRTPVACTHMHIALPAIQATLPKVSSSSEEVIRVSEAQLHRTQLHPLPSRGLRSDVLQGGRVQRLSVDLPC